MAPPPPAPGGDGPGVTSVLHEPEPRPRAAADRRLQALGRHLGGGCAPAEPPRAPPAVTAEPTAGEMVASLAGMAGALAVGGCGLVPAALLSLMALRPQASYDRPPAYAPSALPRSLLPGFDPNVAPPPPPPADAAAPSAPPAGAVAAAEPVLVAQAQPVEAAAPPATQPPQLQTKGSAVLAEPADAPVVQARALPESVAHGTPDARRKVSKPGQVARPNSTPVQTRDGLRRQGDELNWVSDGAKVLSPKHFGMLNGLANTVYALYGVEMTVVTLDDVTGGRNLHDFATSLFNRWGLGDPEVGNGLLVMFVKNKRALEVVTGERGNSKMGMRNVLSAKFTADVVKESMAPHFRQAQFGVSADHNDRFAGRAPP